PSAVAHDLGGDGALRGLHARPRAAPHVDAGDADFLQHPRPARARAGGEGLGDVGGIALAVGGNSPRADEVVGAEERITPPRLVEADLVRLDAEAARHGGVAPELGYALFRARDGQAGAAGDDGGPSR